MDLIIDYQIHILIKKVIEKELSNLNINYKQQSSLQLEIVDDLSVHKLQKLKEALEKYGIIIKKSQKDYFIQKIKDIVDKVIFDEKYHSMKTSNILSDRLNISYGYISSAFSEYCLTTLEQYIILQKIERAKVLILNDGYSLSEIAYMLNYSSVGHLSSQFKKITGLSPTMFMKIIQRRKQMEADSGE
jgi:AraC-like DNA-binding protein